MAEVTQQFKDAGYDWIECAMTNSFPGDAGDLCICCGCPWSEPTIPEPVVFDVFLSS